MISLINSFLESNKFDKLNFLLQKKYLRYSKYFVKSKFKELPEQNFLY